MSVPPVTGPMLIDLETPGPAPSTRRATAPDSAPPMEMAADDVVTVLPSEPLPDTAATGTAVVRPQDRLPWPGVASGANWPLRLFAGGVVLTVAAGLGFDAADLLRRAFAVHPLAGWLTAGVVGSATVGLVAMIVSEWQGLRRLRKLDRMRARAGRLAEAEAGTGEGAGIGDAGALAAALIRHYQSRPDMAAAVAELQLRLPDTHDDGQVLHLLDRTLLPGLDARAFALTAQAARDAAVMTTLLPNAVLDMAVALWRNLRLVRAVATLYGTRPGYWASLRLMRRLLTSLAATGATEGLHHAAVDMLGGSAVAAVSTALGKGLVNGLLTARIGLAAMQVSRPVPFSPATRPGLSGIRAMLLGQAAGSGDSGR